MKYLILTSLLALSGCRMEQNDGRRYPSRIIINGQEVTACDSVYFTFRDGHIDTIYQWPTKEMLRSAWRDSLRAELREVNARRNHPESPNSSAAKVAAVMAAEGITLPQVAAYLNTYGYDVISRAEFKRWHWSPPTTGAPVAYYVVNFRVAIGDTTLPVYIPQTAGPYWIRVKAYDGYGNSGPWSMTSTSAAGDLLPGVVEP